MFLISRLQRTKEELENPTGESFGGRELKYEEERKKFAPQEGIGFLSRENR